MPFIILISAASKIKHANEEVQEGRGKGEVGRRGLVGPHGNDKLDQRSLSPPSARTSFVVFGFSLSLSLRSSGFFTLMFAWIP